MDQYVLDSDNTIWLVVRDGGMATRADYTGIISIGLHRLQDEHGPLLFFTPVEHLRPRLEEILES